MSMTAAFPGRFPSLPQSISTQYPGMERRKFTGDGSPYLRCPGLVAVQQIIVGNGNEPLPETEHRRYPLTGAQGGPVQDAYEPLYMLDRDEAGTPVLVRSVISNDAAWQKDCPIYVLGQWAEEPAPSPAPGKGQK